MAIPTFYYPDLAKATGTVILSARESAHAQLSRRLRLGQLVKLIDGQGHIADGEMVQSERNAVTLSLGSVEFVANSKASITIATAVPKGDRQRTMVDMLTQLGVTKIIPLDCEHSVTRSKAKQVEKWRLIAIEACKQSQNPWLPEIQDACTVAHIIGKLEGQDGIEGAFADSAGQSMAEFGSEAEELLIMVGPEGGFSKPEIELMQNAQLRPLRLANNILRTETAAVCVAAQFLNSNTM